MPPSMQDWLPGHHLARFIAEIMEELDLRPILRQYGRGDGRGAQGYHPVLLVRLEVSSRKIDKATHEDVAFRYLAADQHPDHSMREAKKREETQASALFQMFMSLRQGDFSFRQAADLSTREFPLAPNLQTR